MRLITYRSPESHDDAVGVLGPEERVVDLTDMFGSMQALIEAGPPAIEAVRKRLAEGRPGRPSTQIRLRSPLPVPLQMRDAMCFPKHFEQALPHMARMRAGAIGGLAARIGLVRPSKVMYAQPVYYKCNRFSVVGPERDVLWPRGAELMDFECEMAAVIGKRGKDIPRDEARSFIFGFMVYNDVTARDWQEREMRGHLGPAKGKDFDTGNVLGPWLVTADEIPDPYALSMEARIDGEVWGRGHSSEMLHRWEDLIAHVSRNETLHPGEILASGTVGNGCGLEQGRFLHDGAVMEMEVERLGVLRNRLVRA